MTYDVVLLPGDGIGPEVMGQGRRVLELACRKANVKIELTEIPCGGRYYLEHGCDWPEGSEQRCEKADLLLLGAVGWPAASGVGPVLRADGHMAGWSAVIGNRRRLDLFANLRPIKLLAGVQHRIHGRPQTVWDVGKVDLVIVRENTEGLYAGIGGILSTGSEPVGIDTRAITQGASVRIVRRAFELALSRGRGAPADHKRRVTCIAKHNLLRGCQLFVDVFGQIGEMYPQIEKSYALVDSFAQSLITEPELYDVCVVTNMFGDILTDLGAVLQGGLGLAVGCNEGDQHAMFEPIHGSAPALAGKDRANPMAMILAVGAGLQWLGKRREDDRLLRAAKAIEESVARVILEGRTLTFDLVGDDRACKMSEVGAAVCSELETRLS